MTGKEAWSLISPICEPYFDEDQECWTCNSYEMQENEDEGYEDRK